jgi:hypothetical protein|tara:strand:- start:1251 stop:5018 length:3768 start_codon:yes stop_codon:yes gene_type:complete
MKKLMFGMFLLVFLIGNISAMEFDNKLTYSNNDLKIDLDNWFGFGKNLGTAELKSHPSVNYIKEVGTGKQVVMWYDFNFPEIYLNGLGNVEFINQKTGEIIDRKWRFVYWGNETYKEKTCSWKGIYPNIECVNPTFKDKTREAWLPYDSKNIPKGQIKIGIEVEVIMNDHIDGIWEIAGKKIDRHAQWSSGLETGLVAWYKLDEESGTNADDAHSTNDGTANNARVFTSSEVVMSDMNTGADFEQGADWIDTPSLTLGQTFSMSAWVIPNQNGAWQKIVGHRTDSGNFNWRHLHISYGNKFGWDVRTASGIKSALGTTTATIGQKFFVAGTYNGTHLILYVNGSVEKTDTIALSDFADTDYDIGRADGEDNEPIDGVIDEVAIWSRALSASEITNLFNEGDGCTYQQCFGDTAPTVTTTHPANNSILTSNSVIFSGNASDNQKIVNVSLIIGNTINQTNSSEQNDAMYNFTIGAMPEGTHDWYYTAWDNATEPQTVDSTGMRFRVNTTPIINVFHPTNTTFTNLSIQFNATSSLAIDTFIVNYNGTNTTLSAINTSLDVEDGIHQLLLYGNNSQSGKFGLNDTIFFTINTIPSITVKSPLNQTYSTSSIDFNFTNSTYVDLWTINYNGTNITKSSSNVTLNVEDGFHQLLVYANNSYSGLHGFNNSIYFTVDSTNPSLNVTSPFDIIDYHKTGDNLSLRWNVSDANIDVCRFQFGNTNQTVTCADNKTNISNVNDISITELTFYSNDTFGNSNNTIFTWNYSVWENDRGSRNATIEGATELYYIDFIIQTGSLSTVKLWYDGNDTDSPFTQVSGRNYNASLSNFIVPSVEENKVVNLFWEIAFGSNNVNTSTSTQHINNFALDNCSTNTNILYNFTIVDEETQSLISPSGLNTVKGDVDLEIRGFSTNTVIQTFNHSYNGTNPFTVCLNINLTAGIEYNIDTQVQYELENKFKELYHIQNDTLDSSDTHTNITLFDLDNSTGQIFKITFKDETFLPVSDALINVQRKYIGEGIFKVVEIPKTDSDGEAIAHLVVDDVIYTFLVIKNGVTLGTFNNKVVHCQNPTLTECIIPLNTFASGLTVDDYTTIEGFSFTLDFDEDTREVSSIFTSAETASIKLNVTLFDQLGTTQVCSKTLSSTSGTLSCIAPLSFGNGTIIAKITKDGILQGQGTISLQQSSKDMFGDSQVFVAVFIMMSLVGLAVSNNPIITGVMLMIGAVLNVMLNVTESTGFIGGGATILWLFIAIIIILIKATRRT